VTTPGHLSNVSTLRGVRETPARRAIAAAIARSDHSFTARELYDRLRDGSPVGLVTVYRTLALFRQRGLVRDAGRRGGEALYSACELGQHHHHLVCERCGAVQESTVCQCDALERDLESGHGFVLSSSVANYYGLCAACAALVRGT
jgi:Fur family transcriptional regulator, ferric uptake regulator